MFELYFQNDMKLTEVQVEKMFYNTIIYSIKY